MHRVGDQRSCRYTWCTEAPGSRIRGGSGHGGAALVAGCGNPEAIVAVVLEAYLNGVSTREVDLQLGVEG
jgi:hypothetical protein